MGGRFCGFCGTPLETPVPRRPAVNVIAKAPRNRNQALFGIVPGLSSLLLSICLFYGLFSGRNVDGGAFVFLSLLMVLAFFSSAPLTYYGLRQFGLTDVGELAFILSWYMVPVILGLVSLFIIVVGAIFAGIFAGGGCVTPGC